MRWKPELASAPEEPAVPSEDVALRDRISSDLQARGVVLPAADVLAGRVATDLEGEQDVDYARILDGVALGFRAQSTLAEDLSRSATDLQEIERLMSSFAGELTKLDEVLEVLAAYLRRMRTASPGSGSRMLH
jgi:hypothetical protein